MAFPNKPKAAHHRGTFHVASARCRAQAYSSPWTRCRRCGLTLDEIRTGGPGRPPHPRAKWTAGHVIDGQVGGKLEPECSPCSIKSGAELGRDRALAKRGLLPQQRTRYTW